MEEDLCINSTVLRWVGIIPASLYSLYGQRAYNNKCSIPHKEIENILGIKEYTIRQAKNRLKSEGLIFTKMQGIPAKEVIYINTED